MLGADISTAIAYPVDFGAINENSRGFVLAIKFHLVFRFGRKAKPSDIGCQTDFNVVIFGFKTMQFRALPRTVLRGGNGVGIGVGLFCVVVICFGVGLLSVLGALDSVGNGIGVMLTAALGSIDVVHVCFGMGLGTALGIFENVNAGVGVRLADALGTLGVVGITVGMGLAAALGAFGIAGFGVREMAGSGVDVLSELGVGEVFVPFVPSLTPVTSLPEQSILTSAAR